MLLEIQFSAGFKLIGFGQSRAGCKTVGSEIGFCAALFSRMTEILWCFLFTVILLCADSKLYRGSSTGLCSNCIKLSHHAQGFNLPHAASDDIALHLNAHQHAVGRIQMARRFLWRSKWRFLQSSNSSGSTVTALPMQVTAMPSVKSGVVRRAVVNHERNVGVLQHIVVFAGKAGRCDEQMLADHPRP